MSATSTPRKTHWRTPTTMIAGFLVGAAFSAGHHFFNKSLHGRNVDENRLNQQQNTAIGNAFMFLVRASLIMSIASTYWQVFWSKLHDKNMTIFDIDALHGLLVRVEEFRHIAALRAVPTLALLALLSWLMPFVMIFPPSTLSVQNQNRSLSEKHVLGTPDWNSQYYYAALRHGEYFGPGRWLQRLVYGATHMGNLSYIPRLADNITYHLDFFGPAVSCSAEDPKRFIENLQVAMGGCVSELTHCGSSNVSYRYVSWVPGTDLEVPFEPGSLRGPLPQLSSRLGSLNGSAPSIFIATLSDPDEDWRVQHCQLHNASYKYHFHFLGGEQHIAPDPHKDLGPLVTDNLHGFHPLSFWNYAAMFEILGELLVGTVYSELDVQGREWFHVEDVRALETDIESAAELVPISLAVTPVGFEFANVERNKLDWYIQYLMEVYMIPSLFSDNVLLVDQTEPTQVQKTVFLNVYIYNSTRLLIAYGVATAMTGVAVMIGLIHIMTDGVSYSNRFSTILRTTRQEHLDRLVGTADREGQDPIPPHLAKWKLRIREADHGQPDEMEMNLLNETDSIGADLKSSTIAVTERRRV